MSRDGLLNGKRLQERMGISPATYHVRKKRGEFRRFEVKQPIGTFRYSAELVDRFMAGQPVSQFGRRHL